MGIVRQLGTVLPPEYYAGPTIHLGVHFEVDIGTCESDDPPAPPTTDHRGGVATAVWAPARPTLVIESDLGEYDEYEIRLYNETHGSLLVAAIELVSPSNKDRPSAREQFAAKCVALLRRGVSVAIVDVVTERRASLYAEMLRMIDETDPSLGEEPPGIYAVECRMIRRAKGKHGQAHWLEAWHYPLTIGGALPELPIWLNEDQAVPLDLEASYEQTCLDLRIR